jgi:hypothetical protein
MSGTPNGSPRHRGRGTRRRSARWVPLMLGVLVVATGQTASAYWSGSGDTAGSGATGAGLPLVMAPASTSTSLRPGGTADVVLTISNPNTADVHVATLALDTTQGASGMSVDAAHLSCDTSTLTFVTQTTGWTVPARSGSVDGTVTIVLGGAISLSDAAADSCQGAQFDVHLKGSR